MTAEKAKRVLVVGAKGMLGREAMSAAQRGRGWLAEAEVAGVDIDEVDITSFGSVEGCFEEYRPDVVVNCAGYTNVDGAETDRDRAFAVNGDGPGNLAHGCSRRGLKLVHISTDFVFDGKVRVPYEEDDRVGPLSVYGESKLAGEQAVRRELADHLIVRISWLFGRWGPNFVTTIQQLARERDELRVVSDQVGSPTYAADVVEAAGLLLDAQASGTVHFHNAGHCSWYDFAAEIVRQSGLGAAVRAVGSEEYPRPACRPAWSVMSLDRYEQLTGQMPRPWPEALGAYLAELAQSRPE